VAVAYLELVDVSSERVCWTISSLELPKPDTLKYNIAKTIEGQIWRMNFFLLKEAAAKTNGSRNIHISN
jgi:hypothetical protein